MQVVGFDPEVVDLPLLVGALATINKWAAAEKHLTALGRKSYCEAMRKTGAQLMAARKIKESHEQESQGL
jgi:hypothetical protein